MTIRSWKHTCHMTKTQLFRYDFALNPGPSRSLAACDFFKYTKKENSANLRFKRLPTFHPLVWQIWPPSGLIIIWVLQKAGQAFSNPQGFMLLSRTAERRTDCPKSVLQANRSLDMLVDYTRQSIRTQRAREIIILWGFVICKQHFRKKLLEVLDFRGKIQNTVIYQSLHQNHGIIHKVQIHFLSQEI